MVTALNNHSTSYSTALEKLGMTPASRVIVVGMGVTGLSVLRYLLQNKIVAKAVDTRQQPSHMSQFLQIRENLCPGLEIETGINAFNNLKTATHLIVSPGVALKTPQISIARDSGVQILSDIDLFANQATAPVIAITGSNGKTTVTTLVGKMIARAGKTVAVGGNIGTPVLDLLGTSEPDFYVLELSSFQLENTSYLQPAAAVVLNISADHMDRYDSFTDYANAKARIFNKTKLVVENFSEPVLGLLDNAFQKVKKLTFGVTDDSACQFRIGLINNKEWLISHDQPVLAVDEIAMQGRHNIANVLAALALVDAVNIQHNSTLSVLREFSGLPHRMQVVSTLNSVTWINDSKATNIGACRAALQGVENQVILIAGGDSKGADFSDLALTIRDKVSEMIVLGKDADLLMSAFQAYVKIHRVNTIDEAVIIAAEISRPNDIVLLSPACASLDQFKDYQARGNAFTDAVLRLAK